jgi:hypothetical protein
MAATRISSDSVVSNPAALSYTIANLTNPPPSSPATSIDASPAVEVASSSSSLSLSSLSITASQDFGETKSSMEMPASLRQWHSEFFADAKMAIEQDNSLWLSFLRGPQQFEAIRAYEEDQHTRLFTDLRTECKEILYKAARLAIKYFSIKIQNEKILKLYEQEVAMSFGMPEPADSVPAKTIEITAGREYEAKTQLAEYNSLIERYLEAEKVYQAAGIMPYHKYMNAEQPQQESKYAVSTKNTLRKEISSLKRDGNHRVLQNKFEKIKTCILSPNQVVDLQNQIDKALTEASERFLNKLKKQLRDHLPKIAKQRQATDLVGMVEDLKFTYSDPLIEQYEKILENLKKEVIANKQINIHTFISNRDLFSLDNRVKRVYENYQREYQQCNQQQDEQKENHKKKSEDLEKEYIASTKENWASMSESLPPGSATAIHINHPDFNLDEFLQHMIQSGIGKSALGIFYDAQKDTLLHIAARHYCASNSEDRPQIAGIIHFLQQNGCSYDQENAKGETPESYIKSMELSQGTRVVWTDWTETMVSRLQATSTPCQLTRQLKEDALEYCREVHRNWPKNALSRLFYNHHILCEVRKSEVDSILKGLIDAWKNMSEGDIIKQMQDLSTKPNTGGLGRSRLYNKMIATWKKWGAAQYVFLPKTSGELILMQQQMAQQRSLIATEMDRRMERNYSISIENRLREEARIQEEARMREEAEKKLAEVYLQEKLLREEIIRMREEAEKRLAEKDKEFAQKFEELARRQAEEAKKQAEEARKTRELGEERMNQMEQMLNLLIANGIPSTRPTVTDDSLATPSIMPQPALLSAAPTVATLFNLRGIEEGILNQARAPSNAEENNTTVSTVTNFM